MGTQQGYTVPSTDPARLAKEARNLFLTHVVCEAMHRSAEEGLAWPLSPCLLRKPCEVAPTIWAVSCAETSFSGWFRLILPKDIAV